MDGHIILKGRYQKAVLDAFVRQAQKAKQSELVILEPYIKRLGRHIPVSRHGIRHRISVPSLPIMHLLMQCAGNRFQSL